MLFSDLRHDFTRPYFVQTKDAVFNRMNELYGEMEREGREILRREGAKDEDIVKPKKTEVKRKSSAQISLEKEEYQKNMKIYHQLRVKKVSVTVYRRN
jgi:hypothetical protein